MSKRPPCTVWPIKLFYLADVSEMYVFGAPTAVGGVIYNLVSSHSSSSTDQFGKVKKYYQESLQAQERCNATVSGPSNLVDQSKDTRMITEELLDESQDKLLQVLDVQNKSLNELQQKTNDLNKDVRRLSHKVRAVVQYAVIP